MVSNKFPLKASKIRSDKGNIFLEIFITTFRYYKDMIL